MMQVAVKTVTQALTRSNEAIDGATLHGAALGVTRNTSVAITEDRTGLTTGRDNHEAGKLNLEGKRLARDIKIGLVRAFIRIARDMLRPRLGNQHQASWTAAGFIRTLIIPVTPGKLVVMLETLAAYLTANPAAENAGMNITAAQAETLAAELLAAENAVNAQVVTVKNLLAIKNAKLLAVQKRLGDLFKELVQVMTPLDNRWLAFGFKLPGAEATPDKPQNLVATFIGANAVGVKWDRSARATYYRVFKKVIGVDTDYVQVGSPGDLDMIIEALPSNSQVEIVISANNSGGESARSTVLLVQTL